MEQILVSKQKRNKGTVDAQDFDVPQGIKEVDLFIDRTSLLDEKLAVAVQLFLSLDGGSSWLPWGGFGARGGSLINADTKKIETKSGMISEIPEPKLLNRKIRATLTMTGAGQTALKYEMR